MTDVFLKSSEKSAKFDVFVCSSKTGLKVSSVIAHAAPPHLNFHQLLDCILFHINMCTGIGNWVILATFEMLARMSAVQAVCRYACSPSLAALTVLECDSGFRNDDARFLVCAALWSSSSLLARPATSPSSDRLYRAQGTTTTSPWFSSGTTKRPSIYAPARAPASVPPLMKSTHPAVPPHPPPSCGGAGPSCDAGINDYSFYM